MLSPEKGTEVYYKYNEPETKNPQIMGIHLTGSFLKTIIAVSHFRPVVPKY